jgi:hypothetical protein
MFHRRPAAALALAAAFSLLTAASARAEDVYECAIKQHAENGAWVPEVVVVSWEAGDSTAVVYDPLIDHFIGKPIEAKIETDNAKRTTVIWELEITNVKGQHTHMLYRLTVTKGSLKAQMSARPQRYANFFNAQGTCKKAKG